MSLAVLWYEYLCRRDARKPDGIGRFDFDCFRCNDDTTCCAGCDCCWPPGRCHGATPKDVKE